MDLHGEAELGYVGGPALLRLNGFVWHDDKEIHTSGTVTSIPWADIPLFNGRSNPF